MRCKVAILSLVVTFSIQAAPSEQLLDDAFADLYNFNFPAAHATIDREVAAHPNDPMPYAVRSAAYLFSELDRLGILESEFLVDDTRIVEKKDPPQPDPATRVKFLRAVTDAQSRAQTVLAKDPNDKMALFAMSITEGVATDYMALVEKHQISSLKPAKKSNAYAQRLLKLDPKFYDAYLTAGFSEYLVGSLPFFIRWFVHFDNVSGSKEEGVRNLQLVASAGHYLKPFAKILLGIAALRDKHPRDAQKLLAELSRNYPQNPLFRKELGKLNEKYGAD
ncbi:MAG TPA: hypothetical protein VHW24_04640 [Bryobacteraceae bacterium]|jgi:hypothetical protein|nr:hypothetical protein [Bryobacteraceae bacterium]